MNNTIKIEKINAIMNSKQAKVFDWVLGLSTFFYGIYSVFIDNCSLSWLILFSGVMGVILAYYRPSEILQRIIRKKLSANRKIRK